MGQSFILIGYEPCCCKIQQMFVCRNCVDDVEALEKGALECLFFLEGSAVLSRRSLTLLSLVSFLCGKLRKEEISKMT